MSPLSKAVCGVACFLVALVLAAMILVGFGLNAAFPGPDERPPEAKQLDYALWPSPALARAATPPREVARSFVEDFVGVRNPALGAFEQGDSRSGEVSVHRRAEDGRRMRTVIATIALRQLEGSAWYVIAAFSREVEIATPGAVLSAISSPVRIAGSGVGHEGNVVLRVHAAFRPRPLAQVRVIAGAMHPDPYQADLAFARPTTATGAIVARAAQPLPGSDAFAAIAVRFVRE